MDVVHPILRQSRIGVDILGAGGVPTGPALVGRPAWLTNYIIIIHVLSGTPYAALIDTDAKCHSLLADVNENRFHFSVPTALVDDWVRRNGPCTRLAAYEQMYTQVFSTEGPFAVGFGHHSYFHLRGSAQRVNRILYRSVLRRIIPWAQHNAEDPLAYAWWFVTVPRHMRLPFEGLLANPQTLAFALLYTEAFIFAKCSQDVEHYHGIIQMGIPVTVRYMNAKFSNYPGVDVEPIRASPVASFRYVENQRTGEWVAWPGAQVVPRLANHECAFQRKVLTGHPKPWRLAIPEMLRQGTPWYVIRNACPRQSATNRNAFRRASTRVAEGKHRTWQVAYTALAGRDMPDFLERVVHIFGYNSIRAYASDSISRWCGQPVIVSFTQRDNDYAVAWMQRTGCRVAHLFHIYDA